MTMPNLRRLLAALGIFLGLVAATAHATASNESPDAFIRSLGDEVIGILADKSFDQGKREEVFHEMLVRYVDTDSIARTVLGRYWNQATDAEKQDFKNLYREYIIKIYARRFANFNGEVFNVKSSRRENDRDSVVVTAIEPKQGPAYNVTWRVRKMDDGYRVSDVMAEGISLLVTHNQEFSSVIQNNGGKVAALLDALRKRTAAAGPAK
jgi:phospholipid transport system substrate-binding protein